MQGWATSWPGRKVWQRVDNTLRISPKEESVPGCSSCAISNRQGAVTDWIFYDTSLVLSPPNYPFCPLRDNIQHFVAWSIPTTIHCQHGENAGGNCVRGVFYSLLSKRWDWRVTDSKYYCLQRERNEIILLRKRWLTRMIRFRKTAIQGNSAGLLRCYLGSV